MPGRRNITRSVALRSRPSLATRSIGHDYSHPPYLDNQPLNSLDANSFSSITDVPKLSSMSGIAFETFFLFYLLMAMLAQYLYIFKTVWWYPSTLPPSTTTVNFHLIDQNLTTFLVFIFSQRFLWTLLWDYLKPSPDNLLYTVIWTSSCFAVFAVWLLEMFGYAWVLLEHIKFYKLLFLLCPLLWWIPYNIFINQNRLKAFAGMFQKKSTKPRFQPNASKIANMFINNREVKKDINPGQVRDEVQELCEDFNARLAEIMFYSLTYSYYAGLVPMYFTKSYHSYNLRWCVQHTILLLANSFLMLSSYLLPSQYLQTLSKSAMLLGGYKQVDSPELPSSTVQDWSLSTVFPFGSYVKYKGKTYEACGKHNTAIPDDRTHAKFYILFYKPLRMLNWQLVCLLSVIVFQIYVIVWSSDWDHVIAPAILQFFSYYILRIVLRDRLVLSTFFSLSEEL